MSDDYDDWDDFQDPPDWARRPAHSNNEVQDVVDLEEIQAVNDAEEVQELDQLVEQSDDEESIDGFEEDPSEAQEIEEEAFEDESSSEEEEVLSRTQRRRLALHTAQAASSSSTKKCRCGSTTHRTTAHHDCPLRVKKMENVASDEYRQNYTVKSALDTVCAYQDVKRNIRNVCVYTTRLVYFGSMFVNFLVLYLLERDLPIPRLDQNYLYTCLALVAGEGAKADAITRAAYDDFKETPHWTEEFNQSLKSNGYMSVISYMARTLATDIRLHISENIQKRTITYFLRLMSDTASEHHLNATVAVRKSIANFVWTQRLQTEATWPSSIPRTTATESVVESLKRHFLVCPVPVDEDVYSKPHLFLPWLKIIQAYMSAVVYIREPVAQAFASKAFVHRKLEELPFVATLGSKAKRSLEVNVHSAINLKKAFIKTKKLRPLEPQDVELVQQFIKTVQDRIADGTFAPDKYTDPRGARMFTLLPVFSTQDKNIHIDGEILWKAASAHRSRMAKTLDNKKALFKKVFKLNEIQKDTDKKQFCFAATSDGVSINLHYRRILKKKTEEQKANPFTPANLQRIIQSGNATVWGLDPGVRSIYTAMDNHERRIRSMSSNEYYQRIGNVAYNRFAQHHRERNAADYNIISTLPTLNTSNLTELKQAVDMRIRHYDMTKRFYAYLNTWSLELYRRKQRCLQEMTKQLVGGSKKYSVNTKSFNTKTKPGIHNKTNPKDNVDDNKVVIAFGGAVFRAGVGCRSGPLKSFYNALYHRAIHDSNVYLLKVNEYLTSQVCNSCQTRTLEKKKNATGVKIHAVLQCTRCHLIINRDENAAANIRDIMIFSSLHDNRRPDAFKVPDEAS